MSDNKTLEEIEEIIRKHYPSMGPRALFDSGLCGNMKYDTLRKLASHIGVHMGEEAKTQVFCRKAGTKAGRRIKLTEATGLSKEALEAMVRKHYPVVGAEGIVRLGLAPATSLSAVRSMASGLCLKRNRPIVRRGGAASVNKETGPDRPGRKHYERQCPSIFHYAEMCK